MKPVIALVMMCVLTACNTLGPSVVATSQVNPTVAASGSRGVIEASLPKSVPCDPWNRGCYWRYTVRFREIAGVAVTINRLCEQYRDRLGRTWVGASKKYTGGCFQKTIQISAHGQKTYSNFFREPGPNLSFAGGRLFISYQGEDAHGNAVTGSITATLGK